MFFPSFKSLVYNIDSISRLFSYNFHRVRTDLWCRVVFASTYAYLGPFGLTAQSQDEPGFFGNNNSTLIGKVGRD